MLRASRPIPAAQGDATDAGGPLSSAGDGVTPLPQCLHHSPLGGAGLHGGHPRALVNVDPVHIAHVDDHPTIQGGPPFQGMPAASGAKGDIVLSAPTESINDILDVLTKDDYEGESRELSGPPQTSALIVRTIGKNQTTREFTPPLASSSCIYEPTHISLLAALLSMPLTLLSLRGGTVCQESRARPHRRSATRLPAL